MKKVLSVLLCIAMLFAFAGCSGGSTETAEEETAGTARNIKREAILDTAEYVMLQNIYYNDQADGYIDVDVTKKGVFAILYDAYNSCERYYVWGYNDNTMCCDWQWEFVPKDKSTLPNVGSTIEVSGYFTSDDNALDKYLIQNAEVKVITEVSASEYDIDTTVMGGTLERVQVANMQGNTDQFEGKTVAVYGRIESPTSVQHPYYDNCFSQPFESSGEVHATGENVIVTGTYSGGTITDASVIVSDEF